MSLPEGWQRDSKPCACSTNLEDALQTYYDNRYWSMWKLPMFGCTDPGQVLREINACTRCFPESYVRLVAFDSISQCQTASFLVHRPGSGTDYTHPQVRTSLHSPAFKQLSNPQTAILHTPAANCGQCLHIITQELGYRPDAACTPAFCYSNYYRCQLVK